LGRRWIVAVALGYWFLKPPFGSRLLVAPLVRDYHDHGCPQAESAGAVVLMGGGADEVTAAEAFGYPRLRPRRGCSSVRVFHFWTANRWWWRPVDVAGPADAGSPCDGRQARPSARAAQSDHRRQQLARDAQRR
jgi:hypothetical protein